MSFVLATDSYKHMPSTMSPKHNVTGAVFAPPPLPKEAVSFGLTFQIQENPGRSIDFEYRNDQSVITTAGKLGEKNRLNNDQKHALYRFIQEETGGYQDPRQAEKAIMSVVAPSRKPTGTQGNIANTIRATNFPCSFAYYRSRVAASH